MFVDTKLDKACTIFVEEDDAHTAVHPQSSVAKKAVNSVGQNHLHHSTPKKWNNGQMKKIQLNPGQSRFVPGNGTGSSVMFAPTIFVPNLVMLPRITVGAHCVAQRGTNLWKS